MKYSDEHPPLACMQTHSTCYRRTGRMAVKGVLWHSTGCNNPQLWRYVQPYETDADYAAMREVLGTNRLKNDWNHAEVQAGLNCWIGRLADGAVATVQTMPWDYMPWGCGDGWNGSCNNGWIQFEICEDGLADRAYFEAVYAEACEITAYLCKKYGVDPLGYTLVKGKMIPNILCHQDSYQLGMGSNHGDVLHWFRRFGRTMDDVRNDVKNLIEEDDMDIEKLSNEDCYRILQKAQAHAATLPLPETWEAEGELEDATGLGITDGHNPMTCATRLETAVMVKRAVEQVTTNN